MGALVAVCFVFAGYMALLTVNSALVLFAPFVVTVFIIGLVLMVISRVLRKRDKIHLLEKITGYTSAVLFVASAVMVFAQYGLSWSMVIVPTTIVLYVCGMGLLPRHENAMDYTGYRCIALLPIMAPLALSVYTWETPAYPTHLFAGWMSGALLYAWMTMRAPDL